MRIDLRRYLDPLKSVGSWYMSKPIWLDPDLRSVLLFDDNEIAAALRMLRGHGYAPTTRSKDGGWLVEWQHVAPPGDGAGGGEAQ